MQIIRSDSTQRVSELNPSEVGAELAAAQKAGRDLCVASDGSEEWVRFPGDGGSPGWEQTLFESALPSWVARVQSVANRINKRK